MSTVDKKTADRVISGEFPEDGILAIIKYNNMFNGAEAYKLVFKHEDIDWILHGGEPAILNPILYWRA